jgi:hypothetical protein
MTKGMVESQVDNLIFTIKTQEIGDQIKFNYDVGNVFYELHFFLCKIFNQSFYA